jgi:hypothetical protein
MPRVFDGDFPSLPENPGEVEAQVHWESGDHSVYVPSVVLLEGGQQISRAISAYL